MASNDPAPLFDAPYDYFWSGMMHDYTESFLKGPNGKGAPPTIEYVLVDRVKYNNVYTQYRTWAEKNKVLNDLLFVIAVDQFKKSPGWDAARKLYNEYLAPGAPFHVEHYDKKLVEWIRTCVEHGVMLPRESS